METEARQTAHTFIFVDETGFKLAKTHHKRRTVIGQRATMDVLGQRGANITMCAALFHKPSLAHTVSFFSGCLVPAEERNWDNVVPVKHCCTSLDDSTISASILPLPSSLSGGGRFLTRCPYWMTRMTLVLKSARVGLDIPADTFQDASPEKT